MPTSGPAIILLSGGLDSATALAIARSDGFECRAITFDYGQRHRVEIEAARNVARAIAGGVMEHVVMKIDLRAWGGSALTAEIDVPKDRDVGGSHDGAGHTDAHGLQSVGVEPATRVAPPGDIPITYVPARNTIFLSFALAFAEVRGARDIFIGVNAVDYSGYPDCRPVFIRAFETMANLATRAGVEGSPARGTPALRAGSAEQASASDSTAKTPGSESRGTFRIDTPLIDLTKAQIIRRGLDLGVDYSLTRSCYDPDPKSGKPCGHCDSCLLRAAGFRDAGVRDPLAP